MDTDTDTTYVILSKYTPQGRKYATPEQARKRWDVIHDSLEKTLNGKVLSHYVTLGGYDSVVTFTIPARQDDIHVLQCMRILLVPGDVEITVLRAWEFEQFSPKAK